MSNDQEDSLKTYKVSFALEYEAEVEAEDKEEAAYRAVDEWKSGHVIVEPTITSIKEVY